MATGWRYVFHDLRTNTELATLPLVGVSYSDVLSGVGSLGGALVLTDPELRARDPWAATAPRRTAVYVEFGDHVEFGGIIWGRKRAHTFPGMTLVAASFESYLAHQLLRRDRAFSQATAATMVASVIAEAQALFGANIGIAVQNVTGGGARRDREWLVADAKNILALTSSFAETDTPIEFHVYCYRDSAGVMRRTLQLGEPQLGRTAAASGLAFAYPGSLLSWTDSEDESVMDNVYLGTAVKPAVAEVMVQPTNADGTPATNAQGAPLPPVRVQPAEPEVKLIDQVTVDDVGSDEIAAGFPALMHGQGYTDLDTADPRIPVSQSMVKELRDLAVDGTVPDVYALPMDQWAAIREGRWRAALREAITGTLLTSRAAGRRLDGLQVSAAGKFPLGSYSVGDEMELQITHPAYEEWPRPTTAKVRLLGKTVNVGSGETPTTVALAVTQPDAPRLPPAVTLTAQLAKILDRLRSMETK
jgi:hypothetical protein